MSLMTVTASTWSEWPVCVLSTFSAPQSESLRTVSPAPPESRWPFLRKASPRTVPLWMFSCPCGEQLVVGEEEEEERSCVTRSSLMVWSLEPEARSVSPCQARQ